jgi:hypothetical protein
VSVVVLELEANPGGQGHAQALSALVASALAEREGVAVSDAGALKAALAEYDQEKLASEGCVHPDCLRAVANAVGSRFVLSGRIDKFGAQYVMTAALFDTQAGKPFALPRLTTAAEEELPGLAQSMAQAAIEHLAPAPPPAAGIIASPVGPTPPPMPWSAALRLGSTFIASLPAVSPGADLDLAYSFDPGWVAFFQMGFSFLTATSTSGERGSLRILPSAIGVRHLYQLDRPLQPYWGLGLGMSFRFGAFGFFTQTGPLPTVLGMVGLQYRLHPRFSLVVETSTNLAQVALGLTQQGDGDGVNLDLSFGAMTRF